MPFPAIALGAATKLPKLISMLRAAYASKSFLPWALGGAYVGEKAIGIGEGIGERGLTREQLALQKLLAESGIAASKKETVRAEKKSKEYMDMILKVKEEERRDTREAAMLEMFQQNQNRQMAMIMQATQALSQRPTISGGGMLGVMRGAI